MKKISVYTKTGARAATTYYRVYQYLGGNDYVLHYHKMLPDKLYEKVMPIYTKPIWIKLLVMAYIYFRVLFQLISDLFFKPNILIVSRRFINRFFPPSYRFILRYLKRKGTRIIWDFDDNIIETKEVSKSGFAFLTEISDHIIVASPNNRDMLPTGDLKKVKLLPTTDGDMYSLLTQSLLEWREMHYKKELVIVWTGTSVSLEYVKAICHHIEKAASLLPDKPIVLKVICNLPLEYKPQNFSLQNIKWERDIAIEELLRSHVGIMPLEDTLKNRGKGGFKLIQYMSIGIPVMGSDVGINNDIIDAGTGYSIKSLEDEEWVDGIVCLASDYNKWKSLSDNTIKKWSQCYSYADNKAYWDKMLSYEEE